MVAIPSKTKTMASKFPFIITWLLLFMAIINQSSSARSLAKLAHRRHHNHQKMTFLIKDVLNKSNPVTTKVTSQLPFSQPLGIFPPNGGIPVQESKPSVPVTRFSAQTLDPSNMGMIFPARATLQELEFGTLMVIDEDLFGIFSSKLRGQAQGISVASSEDGMSHMIAITVSFARFFWVHRKNGSDSHTAVTGKYDSANGMLPLRP